LVVASELIEARCLSPFTISSVTACLLLLVKH